MSVPIYQVDAFTDRVFGGNPAAICLLETWPAESLMQAVAAENNLAETAFLVPQAEDFAIRWFTPTVEVDLCGHATLAAGWLILERLQPGREAVVFHSQSGPLSVIRHEGRVAMDFPARPPVVVEAPPPELAKALGGAPPRAVLAARDLLVVYASPAEVMALSPDMAAVAALDTFAICATAPGEGGYDFVSRFFAPRQGIPEDPVTGSAHCTLVPYWASRLGRSRLLCRQASARGGDLYCEDRGGRVLLGGDCAFYMEGRIHV